MGDKQDGLRLVGPDAHDLERHLLAGQRVKGAEGFVHQQDVGVVDQGAADGGALLHAAGKLARVLALEPAQPHHSQQVTGLPGTVRLLAVHHFEREQHVVEDRRPG